MRETKKVRGVFEKVPGSSEWWIQYYDAEGQRRREKVGTRSNAIYLVEKRRGEKLEGKKLPGKLRARTVRFSEIADDALSYVKVHNLGQQFDAYRIGRLKEEFNTSPAEIPVDRLRRWFDEQEWKPGTYNRYKSTLSLIYRLAIEHKKVGTGTNPARLLRRKPEDNGRVRFLNRFQPAKTSVEYLIPCGDEEPRLRAVIRRESPFHLPEFVIALNTGMRPSEQYGLTWDRVDLKHRYLTIPRSKNGAARHIPLNSEAVLALQELAARRNGNAEVAEVFVSTDRRRGGSPLKGYKHWFDEAVAKAGIRGGGGFTWYCLRHTFASRLVMAGVDLRTVAELMGHKTIQMTMRYAHLAPEHNLAAVERLSSFTRPPACGAEEGDLGSITSCNSSSYNETQPPSSSDSCGSLNSSSYTRTSTTIGAARPSPAEGTKVTEVPTATTTATGPQEVTRATA
jgi:integrase